MIGLTESIKPVETKVSENETKLLAVKDKVTQHENQILTISKKQKELEQINSSSYALPGVQSNGQGLTIKSVLIRQAKFSAAIQLGNRPSIIFNGDLYKCVQFVTMFRSTFENVVKDSSALYNLLSRHVTGPTKQAIVPCVYSDLQVDRYEGAMEIL